MNVAEYTSLAPTSSSRESVREVNDVASMSALFDELVNIVVYRRALPDPVADDARRVALDPHFWRLTSVSPDARGRAELAETFAGFPHLAADVSFWTEVLGELTGCDLVGVRFARVESAMCPRLHVDKVAVRVVSTFAGAGTEYVDSEEVDRRWLGHAAPGVSDEESGLFRPGARVRRASLGDVLLLKGEAWPSNQGRGAVHRSPIASSVTPRLVMTLDPL